MRKFIIIAFFLIGPATAHATELAWDWRNVGGVNYISPIKNQHEPNPSCGSCYAMAETAAIETMMMIANGATSTPDLAEQFINSCDKVDFGCDGGDPYTVAAFAQKYGIPPENYYPWAGVNGNCTNTTAGWEKKAIRSISYTAAGDMSIANLENYLSTVGPVIVTNATHGDFYPTCPACEGDGIYTWDGVSIRYGTANKTNHVMLAIGYDHNAQYVIIKNSWGTAWGTNGYTKMAYSELAVNGGDSLLAHETVVIPTGYNASSSITVNNPTASTTVSPGGNINTAWTITGLPGTSVTVALYQGGNLISTLATGQFIGNTTSHGLSVGAIPADAATGSNYRIKVTSDANVVAWSPSFTVAPASGAPAPYKSGRMATGAKVATVGTGGKISGL